MYSTRHTPPIESTHVNVYPVHFTFVEADKESVTVKAAEGESILDLAEENGIHLNHNCGGVCACSTCHAYIDDAWAARVGAAVPQVGRDDAEPRRQWRFAALRHA